jgi:hypothetical protein
MYQHDSAAMFQFVLREELSGSQVSDLEHAWITAKSIPNGKELVVDVSGITNAISNDQSRIVYRSSSGCLPLVVSVRITGPMELPTALWFKMAILWFKSQVSIPPVHRSSRGGPGPRPWDFFRV